MADSVTKWRILFKTFIETVNPSIRLANFQYIDEDSLIQADSLIFDLKSYKSQIASRQIAKNIIESVSNLTITNEQQQPAEEKKEKTVPPKPERPEEPDPDDCCGSGCRVCVFDLYYQKIEQYEEKLLEWEEKYGDNDDED